jgi:pyridoxamine 5'-phosphate oxidase
MDLPPPKPGHWTSLVYKIGYRALICAGYFMEPLAREDMKDDPIEQFADWYKKAKKSGGMRQPETMCLSTIDDQGFPDARMVLLKGFSQEGFIFYTNINSIKGNALKARPQVCLTFYWEKLWRQIRIQGSASQVTDAEADAYFRTRPRLSQLGAWASMQSSPLADRSILDGRVEEFRRRFEGKNVPRPEFWTGFRVRPERMEFWQLRPNRLHDRFLYTRIQNRWDITRLYP